MAVSTPTLEGSSTKVSAAPRRARDSGLVTSRDSAGEVEQRGAQQRQPRRLAQHAVDVGRYVVLIEQPLAPAGEQDDGSQRGEALDGGRDLAAIDARHAEVGDDQREFPLRAERLG